MFKCSSSFANIKHSHRLSVAEFNGTYETFCVLHNSINMEPFDLIKIQSINVYHGSSRHKCTHKQKL